MVVAALIVIAVFVGLSAVRVAGARRSAIKRGQVYAILFAGAGALLAVRGALALGAGLALAALLVWTLSRAQPVQGAIAPAQDVEAVRARGLLGLGEHPTREQIRAAFRTRMAQAHPDRGGDPALAARLTEARDYLLKRA